MFLIDYVFFTVTVFEFVFFASYLLMLNRFSGIDPEDIHTLHRFQICTYSFFELHYVGDILKWCEAYNAKSTR